VSTEHTAEFDVLVRLIQWAIQAHRDLHVIHGSTAVCGGVIGGQALTQHCGVTCGYDERHTAENERWYDVERAYFRLHEGDPEWAEYIPGGRLSTCPTPPGSSDR